MKPLLTYVFVVVLSSTALANSQNYYGKINAIKMALVLDGGTVGVNTKKKIETTTNKKVTLLYRRKNTLIIKALNFRNQESHSKMA